MLNRALDIHASAEKPKDREWIHILLHFLRAYVDDMGMDLLLSTDDSEAYVAQLVSALKDAAHELDSGMTAVRSCLIWLTENLRGQIPLTPTTQRCR